MAVSRAEPAVKQPTQPACSGKRGKAEGGEAATECLEGWPEDAGCLHGGCSAQGNASYIWKTCRAGDLAQ